MTSRRQLYAAGETFGESCTRMESGRRVYGGGGGSSSSSSNATTTQNTDRRQVVDGGSVGVSSDSSTVNVTTLDQGAVKQAIDLVAGAGTGALTAYKQLLDTTALLATQSQATMTANTDLAAQLATNATGQPSSEETATQEKYKQWAMYAAAGFVVYIAMKKG